MFRTPFVDLGLVPEAASSLIMPAIVGRQQAFALLALGQGFSADRAKTAGLIYDVVDEDDLERDVFAAAEEIASKPAEALKIAREPAARSARAGRRAHPRGGQAFRRKAALRRSAHRPGCLHEPQERLAVRKAQG